SLAELRSRVANNPPQFTEDLVSVEISLWLGSFQEMLVRSGIFLAYIVGIKSKEVDDINVAWALGYVTPVDVWPDMAIEARRRSKSEFYRAVTIHLKRGTDCLHSDGAQVGIRQERNRSRQIDPDS